MFLETRQNLDVTTKGRVHNVLVACLPLCVSERGCPEAWRVSSAEGGRTAKYTAFLPGTATAVCVFRHVVLSYAVFPSSCAYFILLFFVRSDASTLGVPLRPGMNSTRVQVGFVMDKVAL